MKQFTDITGETWDIVVNNGTLNRVNDLLDINLCNPFFAKDGERVVSCPDCGSLVQITARATAQALLDDYLLLGKVLYALCGKQAEARRLGADEFYARLNGEVLEPAGNLLLEELLHFFPRSRQESMRQVIELAKQLQRERNALRILDAEPTSSPGSAE